MPGVGLIASFWIAQADVVDALERFP